MSEIKKILSRKILDQRLALKARLSRPYFEHIPQPLALN